MDGYGSYGGGGGYGGDGGYGGYGGAGGYGGDGGGGYSYGGAAAGYDAGGAGGYGGAAAVGGGYGGAAAAPTGDVSGSQPSPSRGKLENQSITAVTMKQLLGATSDHPDNEIHISGRPIHKVHVCGCVTAVKATGSNFLEMTLNDCTGAITVKRWTTSEDQHTSAQIREGTYVTVIGTWKKMNDKKEKSSSLCLVAQSISIVKDFNQVTHHLLDALYVHLVNTRGAPTDKAAPAAASAAAGTYGASTGFATAGAGGFSATSSAMGGAGAGSMSSLQMEVLEQFQGCTDAEKGMDVREVVKNLTQLGHSEANIMQAVSALATDGHLYNTVDDNHFQHASAGGSAW